MNALDPAAVNPIADDVLAGVAVSDRSGASDGHDPVFELVSNVVSTILINLKVCWRLCAAICQWSGRDPCGRQAVCTELGSRGVSPAI